ncbi:hypothetical protein [Methylacidiphilum kamchatkense]|uniref:hypothetical protein n=1 Tax=Methylacidiphilum kamchatkense TaxID=431057 RepID=UPI00155AF0C3|nr:hypothetical protein [Methylacidiphilum kamchatkense]
MKKEKISKDLGKNGLIEDREAEGLFVEQTEAPKARTTGIRKGKCINFGECEEAGKITEVPEGAEFVCKACKKPLEEVTRYAARSSRSLFPLIGGIGLVIVAVLALLFVIPLFNGMINGQKGIFKVLESKPSLLQAEEAIKAQIPKGFAFVDIKEKSAVKDQNGQWNLDYEVTVQPQLTLFWVPVGPVLPGKERLEGVPKDLQPWAKSHIKDLLFTLDQEPGMVYYQDQKRTAFEANQPVTLDWKVKAIKQADGGWKFLNEENKFPWAAMPEQTIPGTQKTVLYSAYDLATALRQEDSQWVDLANRLKEIDKQAAQVYMDAKSEVSSPGRKPKYLQPGTGGPTTAAEGAGIGAAGGALIGGLAGGGAGAGWGALGGLILGGLGGGLYSYEKEKKAWRARVAAHNAALRRAAAKAREEKERLLEQYAQELRQMAENRRLALSGVNPIPNPSSQSPQIPASPAPYMPTTSSQPLPPPPFPSNSPASSPSYPQFPGSVPPAEGYGPPPGAPPLPPPPYPQGSSYPPPFAPPPSPPPLVP